MAFSRTTIALLVLALGGCDGGASAGDAGADLATADLAPGPDLEARPADMAPGNACWTGAKTDCYVCCGKQVAGGPNAFITSGAATCVCDPAVCGTAGTCSGGSGLCQDATYIAGCQDCLRAKFTEQGSCAASWSACDKAADCKAWMGCILGCP